VRRPNTLSLATRCTCPGADCKPAQAGDRSDGSWRADRRGGVAGTAAVKAFDVEAARTGILDHKIARETGFDPITETIEAKSRAGYYPEGGTVRVTLTIDCLSGRVLGGSLVSEYGEGAVHRSHASWE